MNIFKIGLIGLAFAMAQGAKADNIVMPSADETAIYMSQDPELEVDVLDDQTATQEVNTFEELLDSAAIDNSMDTQNFTAAKPPYKHKKLIKLVCFASNGKGVVFRAKGSGFSAKQLQRMAMKKCKNNSKHPKTCKPLGCKWTFSF
jgi:hypothetical protein